MCERISKFDLKSISDQLFPEFGVSATVSKHMTFWGSRRYPRNCLWIRRWFLGYLRVPQKLVCTWKDVGVQFAGGTRRFLGHLILTSVCVTRADILASASSTLARVTALVTTWLLQIRRSCPRFRCRSRCRD